MMVGSGSGRQLKAGRHDGRQWQQLKAGRHDGRQWQQLKAGSMMVGSSS